MKADFSRSTFDPHKHYTSVRMQQGRVQLDADWNEQADILLHLIRTPLGDLLGPGATAATEPGFAITLVEPADQAKEGQPEEPTAPARTLPDFQIGPGRYYVEGMLCENKLPVLFSKQPDHPAAASVLQQCKDRDQFLVYLDVWPRHITAAEDPTVREIALGGPDTTTRVKTVWQVKLLPLSGAPANDEDLRSLADWKEFVAQASQKGLLKARWDQAKGAFLENRLYRVEIHNVADGQVTFKWSRENGSVVFPVEDYRLEREDLFTWEDVPGRDNERLLSYLREGLALDWAEGESVRIDKSDDASTIRIEKDRAWAEIMLDKEEQTATLTTSDGKRGLLKVGQKEGKHELYRIIAVELNLEGLERDPHQLQDSSWVELIDDVTVLSRRSLPLCKVTELDRPNARVILRAEREIDQIVAEIGARELQHPLLRRWEDDAKLITPEPDTTATQGETWFDLENGIQVAFSGTGIYQVGDYWLIPARTRSTDGIEWPRKDGQPLAQAPHGIVHHYAPLGLLQFKEGHWSVLTEESSAFRSLPRITANLCETDGQLRKVQETTDKRFEEVLSRLREVRQTMDTLVAQTHVFAIVKSEKPLEEGDLVCLDLTRMAVDDPSTEIPVKLASSETREGHLVLGVVTEPLDDHRYRVALYGRVNCKVIGPVEPGDLLLPSPEPGHAQKRGWFFPMGPAIGRALSSTVFDEGRQTGTLDMLVTPNYRITGPKPPSQKWVAIGIGAVALILVLSVMGLFLEYFKTFRLDIYYSVGGFVTKNPDKASYNRGDEVTLTAVSDPNYTFGAWSGDLSGSKNPVTLVMDADKSVTANFGIHSLTVSGVHGSVTKDPNQASYEHGTKVALTAVPDPNYAFDAWSGDLSGSANPATLVMDAHKSVTACFVITNSIGMKLVYIPPGSFRMGSRDPAKQLAEDYNRAVEQFTSEFPHHQVRISRGFWMGQTEVTQKQFLKVMRDPKVGAPNYGPPWSGKPEVVEDANNPAVYVSWNDASDFCKKLSQKERKTYRLPTEAEWEYACRAGTTTQFSFGDSYSSLGDYAWFFTNSHKQGQKYAHLVGQKEPNPWGLYDMHGNVGEWCNDWYDPNYYDKSPDVDPPGPSSPKEKHCSRGGGWYNHESWLRCSSRLSGGPTDGYKDVGFRVVRME